HRLALGGGRTAETGIILREIDSITLRERAHCLGEGKTVYLHEEVEDGAANVASETMEEAALSINRERRRFFLMKRTKAYKAAAGACEPHMRADYLDDVRALAGLLELIVAESSHQALSTSRSWSG